MRADAYYNTKGNKCAFVFNFKTGRNFVFKYDGNELEVVSGNYFSGHYDHVYNIYGASEMQNFLKMKNDKNLADRLLDYPDAKGFNQLISIEKKELCEEFFGIPMTNMLCHFQSNLPPMKTMLKKMSNGWKTEDNDDASDSRLTNSLTDEGLLEDVEDLMKQAMLQKKNQKKKIGTRKQSSSKANDDDSNKKRIVKYIGENENGLVKNNFYLLVERIDMFSSRLLVPTGGKVAVENRFIEFSPSKTNSNNSNPSSQKHSINRTNVQQSTDDDKSDEELVEELLNSLDEEVETTTNNAVRRDLNVYQDDEVSKEILDDEIAEEIIDALHNEGIADEEVKNVLDNYNTLTAMWYGNRKFSAQDEELKDILRRYFGMSFKGDKEDDDDEVMF